MYVLEPLADLVASLGTVRGDDGDPREGRGRGSEFQPGHGDPHDSRPGFTWLLASDVVSAKSLAGISQRTWIFLVLSGLATACRGSVTFRRSNSGNASRVAPVDKLSVIFAIVMAGWFLYEPFTWHHWVGGSLILCGAIVIASK